MLMKKCAFTIVAKNYIGLAKLLGKSIKNTTMDVDFYIFTADEIGTNSTLNEDNIFEAKKRFINIRNPNGSICHLSITLRNFVLQ